MKQQITEMKKNYFLEKKSQVSVVTLIAWRYITPRRDVM